ncbi:MAG: O-antigen ligase family protein [Sphingomonadaceae bacterium]
MDAPRGAGWTHGEGEGKGRTRADPLVLAFALVACAPALMAVATWNPLALDDSYQTMLRFFGLPVVMVELIVIGLAFGRGFRPRAMLARWRSWQLAALAGLGAIALANAAFVAPEPAVAWVRLAIIAVHLVFGLAVAHLAARGRREDRALWWLLAAGACLYAAILALFVASIPDPRGFDWRAFGLGVVNIRHVGFYAVAGLVPALVLAATARDGRGFWLATGLAALLFALLFWSGSRGGLLAAAGGFGLASLILPAIRGPRAPAALALGAAAGLLLSLAHAPPDRHYGAARISRAVFEETGNGVSSGRFDLWAGTLERFFERPLFGWGESQLIALVPAAQDRFHHPHNALLQSLFQWGLVGTALVLALALWAVLHMLALSRAEQEARAPVFALLAAFAIYAAYDGVLYFVYPAMLIAAALGYALAAPGSASTPRPVSAWRARSKAA